MSTMSVYLVLCLRVFGWIFGWQMQMRMGMGEKKEVCFVGNSQSIQLPFISIWRQLGLFSPNQIRQSKSKSDEFYRPILKQLVTIKSERMRKTSPNMEWKRTIVNSRKQFSLGVWFDSKLTDWISHIYFHFVIFHLIDFHWTLKMLPFIGWMKGWLHVTAYSKRIADNKSKYLKSNNETNVEKKERTTKPNGNFTFKCATIQ